MCFRFSAKTDNGDERDGLISMKECGVHLIFVSDFESFLQGLELDLELKLELGLKLRLALDMEHRSLGNYRECKRLLYALENGYKLDESLKLEFESRRRPILELIEKESNDIGTQIRNQEWDTSEKCLCSCDCLIDMKILTFAILAYVILLLPLLISIIN